jgi:hypothetical protein
MASNQSRRLVKAARMENATKRAPLERSAAACDPAIKDLLGTNAIKPEYCSRPPRSELTDTHSKRTLGPLFRLQPGGVVAPWAYRLASR